LRPQASGNDIGALLSNLPEDCAGLRKLNATELNDGQYERSVNKVHAQIEGKALELADSVLAEQWVHTRSPVAACDFWVLPDRLLVLVITGKRRP
jgi:hypothetical protein